MGIWRWFREFMTGGQDTTDPIRDYIPWDEVWSAVLSDYKPGGVLYPRVRTMRIRERELLNQRRAKLGWPLLPEIPEGYEAEE